jgi:UDP-glucose 4-epimerase
MKVLITGGAGFIGSHLAERHLTMGDDVCIVDDLSTGEIANVQHLKIHPQFSYYIDSVTNRHLMAELVDLCDIVYHLAAAVGVRLIVDSPVRTIETNIRGTEIILELAETKRKRVLITSTSEVYGKLSRVPFREDDDLVMGPTNKSRWSYACSKAIDEFLAIAYWKEKKVPTVIARLFNTVGPRQTGRYGMVVPNFVVQALTGKDITLFGDGAQSRCFTNVNDTVDALVGIASHPDANGEVYNVGSDHEVTIIELATRIKHMTNSNSRIIFVPYGKAYEEGFEDVRRRVPDISKLTRLIGYRPRLSLDQTLESIIVDQRARLREHGVAATVR